MKKILVLLCLICSMSVSADTLKTDNPNRYLKNFTCDSKEYASFNAVNKTDSYWGGIIFNIYDSDNDPIDNFRWVIGVAGNSGKSTREWLPSCKQLIGNKYKIKTY